MVDEIIAHLHGKLAALRAEWESLGEQRRVALLGGDTDALLRCIVRETQIPFEAVEACQVATHALLTEREAEARELEAERDALAAQLADFEAEVNALWERIRPVQERYLRVRNNGHTATIYTIRASQLHEGVATTDGASPLERLLNFELPRVRRAAELLEQWQQAVAKQDARAVQNAVQLMYGVAPSPIDRVLRFREYAATPAEPRSIGSPSHTHAASVATTTTAPQAHSPRVRKREEMEEQAHDTATA